MNKEEFLKRLKGLRQEREKAYAEMDTDKKLLLNIAMLGRRSHAAVDKKSGQNRVLVLLKEMGPMSQRDLTLHLGIQPGSASEILKKLEDAYLIERVNDENDRRGKMVKLTENGDVLAESLKGKEVSPQDGAFSALNAEEKDTLLALMEKVNRDWQTRFPVGPEAHMRPPKGFGPFGPEGFGPHGPEGFGPFGPEGFRHHGGPGRFGRKFYGDMDRKGPEGFDHEYNGDMDRKGPGDFNPGCMKFRKKEGEGPESMA